MHKSKKLLSLLFSILAPAIAFAGDLDTRLSQTATPYIKYFTDRALGYSASEPYNFRGFTRSFQLYRGQQAPTEETVINYSAFNYDQIILGRISLAAGTTTILDTYTDYFLRKSDVNNPIFNCRGDYYDGSGLPLRYGPFKMLRILGRNIANWYNTWEWTIDIGAADYLIVYAAQAYQKTQNINYKNLAIFMGDYLLSLRDGDEGIRYAPRGVYHASGPDFFWNLKSTEQNENALYALEALYTISGDIKYSQAADKLKIWLKSMYDKNAHLFSVAATYSGSSWVKRPVNEEMATDVIAFAPIDLMFSDSFFGATQEARDAEVDAMFQAIETRTAFLNADNRPAFFRFSIFQTGAYGSVEMSSQMALAYLRVAQNYSARGQRIKAQQYLDKYNTLIASLETFFSTADGDSLAKVAPYASYYSNKAIAGGVTTSIGSGYTTMNCQAALASVFYAFAKTGFDTTKIDGGTGIPEETVTINLSTMPWYQSASPYNSTGSATAQMILNYVREGSGQAALTQNQIYEYARGSTIAGADLTPDEMVKVLGHFDPNDSIVSNSHDTYDNDPSGNPYQGYNYGVETFDPALDQDALNRYMRDICHWMAYTVTTEYGGNTLVAKPNVPAAIPLYGQYNHWVAVQGFAARANPAPTPRTDPRNTPEFTVYGFMFKDPLVDGIGQSTYKTAAECIFGGYFAPVTTSGAYYGRYIQVAEPPPHSGAPSKAKVKIPAPVQNKANLLTLKNARLKSKAGTMVARPDYNKIVDSRLLSDPKAKAAFTNSLGQEPILVKGFDPKNVTKTIPSYYLIPFNKYQKKGPSLTTAVVILDANNGYFKEASWTDKPEQLLKVTDSQARSLIRNNSLTKFYQAYYKYYSLWYQVYYYNRWPGWYRRANLNSQLNAARQEYIRSYNNYLRIYYGINSAQAELIWQPKNKLSATPYKPYWKIALGLDNFYVTQEGKLVVPGGF